MDNLDGSCDCGNKRQYESTCRAVVLLHSNGLLYVRIEAGGKESVRETVSRHGRDGAWYYSLKSLSDSKGWISDPCQSFPPQTHLSNILPWTWPAINSPVLAGIYYQPYVTWIPSYFTLSSAEYASHNDRVEKSLCRCLSSWVPDRKTTGILVCIINYVRVLKALAT